MNASAWSNCWLRVARGIRWNTAYQLFAVGLTFGAMLAEGLEYFLAEPERRELAGRAARASADRFDPQRFARAWWDLFSGASDRS